MATRIPVPGRYVTEEKVTQPGLTKCWLQCKPGFVLLLWLLVYVMALEWLGGVARDAYCQLDEYVDETNRWLFGDRFAGQLNRIQDSLGLNPCDPSPTPPPGEGFQNPGCNGMTDFEIEIYRGEGRNDTVVRGGAGYVSAPPSYNEADGWGFQVTDPVTGVSFRSVFSQAGANVPHTVTRYQLFPRAGVTCATTPPPVNQRPDPPAPRRSPPTTITPPPPSPQTPLVVNFNFFPPINLPGIIPVVIPVIARITPTVNFSPTFNIPFTLQLPDLNANFDFAFNPHFNLVNINGELINWPPPGVRPEDTTGECQQVDPPPPLFKIEERIIGAFVYYDVNSPVRGKTRTLRGASSFDESIYPRYGHVQFLVGELQNVRIASSPVTERYGFVPCPDPYGATSVQFNPEPGMPAFTCFGIKRPVAIPIKADGTSPIGYVEANTI